eukprot:scaffold287597_cov33-Prasinocladus_malaysianus.AAC.1
MCRPPSLTAGCQTAPANCLSILLLFWPIVWTLAEQAGGSRSALGLVSILLCDARTTARVSPAWAEGE